MSRTRRGEREQGHEEEEVYWVQSEGPSLLSWLGDYDGFYPGAMAYQMVQTRRQTDYGQVFAFHYLLDADELGDFVRYVCPRLEERRELQTTKRRLRGENERLSQELQDERRRASEAEEKARVATETTWEWCRTEEKRRQQVATLEAEKEQLQQQLRREQRKVAEVTAESERMSGVNTRLRQEVAKAEQGIDKAGQEANEARVEASSVQEKLKETETAYEEAKKHFIMAPDLVPCLRSLSTEVKALHEEVRASGEKTIDAVVRRPPDERRNGKTLRQMRRVLHDIGRFPRRQRRGRAAGAADDGGEATKRGRVCYSCRCKGHLAKNCPRARTDTVASAEPTGSDTQPSSDVAAELNAASAYSGLNILSFFRRNFTSGID